MNYLELQFTLPFKNNISVYVKNLPKSHDSVHITSAMPEIYNNY